MPVNRWNEIYYHWRPNPKDDDDNFIVELAVAGGSEYVITYNTKDFKNYKLTFKHKIITPEALMKELP